MHQIQQAYLTAKSAYDAALVAHNVALESRHFFTLLEQNADTDTLVAIEVDAETESHHDDAFMAWRQAKDALFTWGQKMALLASRARKNPHEAALVLNIFDKIHRYPNLEGKLIDLCLKLELPN